MNLFSILFLAIIFTLCNSATSQLLTCDEKLNLAAVDIPTNLTYDKKKISFRLTPGKLNCKNDTFLYTLKMRKPPELRTAEDSTTQYFLSDGVIRFGKEYFSPNEYCLKKITKTKMTLEVCKINCEATGSVCIPKCCEIGKSFDPDMNRCVRVPAGELQLQWSPTGSSPNDLKKSVITSRVYPHYHVEDLKCAEPELWTPGANITGFKQIPFQILLNNQIIYLDKSKRKWVHLSPKNKNYCVDQINSGVGSGSLNTGTENEMLAICINLDEPEREDGSIAISIIYGLVMFISCALYAVTIVVHIILWKQQKFHMYIVISYVLSLLLLHIFFGSTNMVQLQSMDEQLNGSMFCVVTGAASHLFILSTFCWLTMINMNLWSTFSALNVPHPPASGEGQGIGRFIWFSLFSWGLPAAVVAAGLTLDKLNKKSETDLLGPNYGQTRCLISTEAEGWYLFYPIGVLLVCNMSFFGLTILRLFFYQKITRNVIGEKSDRKWRIVSVYMRLLVIASILWAFELISWLLVQESHAWYWLIVDFLNLLQSAVIFIMFVCRKSINDELQKKFPTITKYASIFSSACCCGEETLLFLPAHF